MANWVSGEWYLLDTWPDPSWDQGNKWQTKPVCGWQIDRDGLYLFSLCMEVTISDVAVNDFVKLYMAIGIGDPDTGGIVLAAGDSLCTADMEVATFAVHAWRPLRAGVLVQTYGGQRSDRDRTITIAGGPTDYFSYNRMGSYPQ